MLHGDDVSRKHILNFLQLDFSLGFSYERTFVKKMDRSIYLYTRFHALRVKHSLEESANKTTWFPRAGILNNLF